ncbi:hypothetical protein GCM10017044_05930 [Kordiimonas sediminis]|uniref:Uncharacterized protein n=1 Tax=Kordiimonas sediminis TaxID=1735581 RepID=A0A919AMC1_9PROT|nr:hypothetical protein [Kordiimonas sediminis]GHF14648.1 hypothetical protein GCM10017044_05930 [Kordiimonas sediminis]
MMSGTERGHEIRRYFIEVEKGFRERVAEERGVDNLPDTFAKALGLGLLPTQ